MIDYGLKDRVVIITGANNPQGIGECSQNQEHHQRLSLPIGVGAFYFS